MQQLATIIRAQLDTLVDQYDARLRTMPGYSSLPEAMRRDLERNFLNLIVQSLEAGDYSLLVQYAQQRASQWDARGLNLAWFQQALIVPEELLVPFVQSVETSNFVWQALNRSQSVVWQMVAERTHQTEERFRSIVETAHSGIMIIDDQFHFTYVNEQLTRISGYSPPELIGADFRQLLDEDSRQLVADRYVRRQRGEDLPADYEVAFIRKDGQKRYVEMSAVLLPDVSGRLQTVAQVLDVTEQKQALAALAQERNLLHTLIDSLPDQIFFKDTEGRVILNNMADARAMRVASPAEAIGKNVFDVFPVELAELYHADDMTVIHSGQSLYNREEPGIDEAGQTRWIQTSKVPLTDELGKPIGLVGFAHDITQRKQAEQRVQELLEMREHQAHTSTEVSQEIAAAPELHELFQRVVTLIKKRFNYYHAQIFRYDPTLDAIVLVTGYGEVGQHMLADGHQLPMGRGVVGTAAATGQTILATDVTQDQDWRPNPYLPDTRGELAVPIKLREKVLGILDVQSDRAGALSADDRLLLEGLCGQIAVAIESTRLLDELRRSEGELSQALQIAKLAYWEYDVEKDLFLFNDQFFSIFHTTVEQEGGYQLSSAQYAGKFVYPEDLSVVGSEIERALNSTDRHYSRDLVHRIQYADGGVGYMSVSINIDRDEQGHILRYYGANQDVTATRLAEEEMQRTQRFLDSIVENLPIMLFVKDARDLRFIRWNKAGEELVGFPRADMIGKSDLDFFPPEEAEQFMTNDRQVLVSKQPIDIPEEQIQTQFKGIRTLHTRKIPILDEQGHPQYLLGISEDITERKQAEAELAHSAQLLHTIVQTVPDYLYVKNTKSEFLLANQALADTVRLASPDELIGKTDFDFFPPNLAEKFYQDEQAIIQSGQPMTNIEEPSQAADGRELWLSTTKVPFLNSHGEIEGIVGLGRNITERRQAELRLQDLLEKVQQSEQLMRTLIDAIPDEIYTKDTQGRLILANAAEAQQRGVASPEQLIGQSDFDFYPRELAEQYFAAEQPIYQEGQSLFDFEEQSLNAEGRSTWHASTKVPLRNIQGQIVGLVGMTRDITEQKHIEQEREQLLQQQLHRNVQLQASAEIGRAATSILNPDLLLGEIVKLIAARFDFYHVAAFTVDESGRWAQIRAATGEAGQQLKDRGQALGIHGKSLTGRAIRHRQPQMALDVGAEAVSFNDPLLPATRSEIALPLFVGDRVLGALDVQSTVPAAFDDNYAILLQSMADQIAVALNNAEQYQREQAHVEQTNRLMQIVIDLSERTDRAGLQNRLVQSILSLLDTDRAQFWLKGASGLELKVAQSVRPGADQSLTISQELADRVWHTGLPLRLDSSPAQAGYASRITDVPFNAALITPISWQGNVTGVLSVMRSQPGRPFTQDDENSAQLLAAQAAAALENITLAEQQQHRAVQLQTAAEVSQVTSSILSLDTLLPQAAEVVRARFNLYYVGIFLTDEAERWAVLRAGTGDAGQQMLANGHRLKIGEASMISECIVKQQAQIALDVGAEAVRFDNPRLPLTRSELALPLISRGRVIGAVTIQSDQPAAFTSDDITGLQTMADQIGNAVENARLYEQSNAALQEVDALNRRLTGEAWESYLHHQGGQQVISVTDDSQTAPDLLPLLDGLLAAGEVVVEPAEDDQSEATVTAPILLRGQPIGALRMRTSLDTWNKDTETVLTDIAGHIAQAVENARLIEQTQRTASRERAINEINARVRQTIDLDAILRTAVNELGQSLKAARVTARINVADSDPSSRRPKTDTGDQPQPGAAGSPRGNDHD